MYCVCKEKGPAEGTAYFPTLKDKADRFFESGDFNSIEWLQIAVEII